MICSAAPPRTQIATVVERHPRIVLLVRLPNGGSATVARALTRQVKSLPRALHHALTSDRGLELFDHESIDMTSDFKVNFCDPRSPWQRGTNENTNGLLRQCFSTSTDPSNPSQANLDRVALQIKQRPREALGFDTPADELHARVTPTS
ncbi:MAG: IS30 family transposase [Myxococcota bacterium]